MRISFALLALHNLAHADSIDDYVQTEMQEQNIPGVAIGIFRNGEVLRAQGYGLANVEHQVPVKPETVFQTASIGKMFTATAAMLLVEDGKLALDAPLTTYLPDAPPSWQATTLRHLLNHTSGLGYPKLDFKQDYSDDELLALIHATEPEFAPGQRWSYSNAGYMVAGILVGKVGGQHYSEVLQERVFQPSGMSSARLLSHIDIVPNRAAGYASVRQGEGDDAPRVLKNQDWVSVTLNNTADGSLQMSVLDFARWDAVVARRAVLKDESWRQVLDSAPLNNGTRYAYGYGWELEGMAEHPKHMGHGGAWQGFRSYYRRYDEDGVSFVVLANSTGARPEAIVRGIAERFDSRYKQADTLELAIEDTRPELARNLADALQRVRDGQAADHPALAALLPERRERMLDSMSKVLKEAGACPALMELVAEKPNGDQLSRTYRSQCANGMLRVSPVFDERGQIVRAELRLEKP
ncbi:serine hydrolase domain-containing protein [Thauera sp. SDU_THAU2]|uniref:serine hydrolase domain-containing protein n=1 Tax=Thauera sp. SDU_THAU2 TaxID=3136633 RepID=UPI003120173E